jgi:hypothetical protein
MIILTGNLFWFILLNRPLASDANIIKKPITYLLGYERPHLLP